MTELEILKDKLIRNREFLVLENIEKLQNKIKLLNNTLDDLTEKVKSKSDNDIISAFNSWLDTQSDLLETPIIDSLLNAFTEGFRTREKQLHG